MWGSSYSVVDSLRPGPEHSDQASFVSSFNKDLLNACCVPTGILRAEDTAMTKPAKSPFLKQTHTQRRRGQGGQLRAGERAAAATS